MQTRNKIAATLISAMATGLMLLCPLAQAGDLEPLAAPGPTMKTLDQVEPRIPIPGSLDPIDDYIIANPGSYYLTGDRHCNAYGIRIQCDNVTVDLMGHSLVGPGAAGPGYSGFYLVASNNIEIRNGTIREFGHAAIYEANEDGKNHRVIDIRAIGNGGSTIHLKGTYHLVRNCTVIDNGGNGIYVEGSHSMVVDNVVCDNDGDGINTGVSSLVARNITSSNDGVGIYAGSASSAIENTVYRNGSQGIQASNGCTVIGNTVDQNGDIGIDVGYGSTVKDNTCRINADHGIQITTDSLVINNTCDGNGQSTADGAGIQATNTDNRIEANHVTDNDRGIAVSAVGNLIVKNTAAGNNTNYDIVPGNKVGTISADPANAGPWDNFEF